VTGSSLAAEVPPSREKAAIMETNMTRARIRLRFLFNGSISFTQ